jgi:hypothetical protein
VSRARNLERTRDGSLTGTSRHAVPTLAEHRYNRERYTLRTCVFNYGMVLFWYYCEFVSAMPGTLMSSKGYGYNCWNWGQLVWFGHRPVFFFYSRGGMTRRLQTDRP